MVRIPEPPRRRDPLTGAWLTREEDIVWISEEVYDRVVFWLDDRGIVVHMRVVETVSIAPTTPERVEEVPRSPSPDLDCYELFALSSDEE